MRLIAGFDPYWDVESRIKRHDLRHYVVRDCYRLF